MKRDGHSDTLSRIMPWFAAVLVLLICSVTRPAYGAGGDIVWQAGDARTGKQQAVGVAVDSQGSVIVTGYQNATGDTNDNYYTVKFAADGSGVVWRAAFDKAGGTDQATAVAVDANNDVVVAGFVWNGLNRDIHTIKYSGATGALLWQHTWNGSADGHDIGTAVAVDRLNNIYVTGTSQNAAGNDDIIILKYSPTGLDLTGSPFWQISYNGPSNGAEQAFDVTAGSDGVAVTGQSWNGTAFDFFTVKYDYSAAKLWEARHPSTGGGLGKKVRMDAGGDVIVVGYAATLVNKDIYTAKYNGAGGALVWEKIFDGGYDDEGNGLYVDAAGDVYITGYSWTLTDKENFYTARYAGAGGNLVWQQTFASGGGNTDVAAPIIVDEAGDLFVTGYTVTEGNYDFQTHKYKRDTGTLLWRRSFNATANLNDRPVGIGLSPAGEVLVAGWSDSGGNNPDYYVVKYDPGLLNPPTDLSAVTQSDTGIRLTWLDNSGNEDGFRVERKTGETGTYALIASLPPNTTEYIDPAVGLTADTYYYYRVQSYNAASGNSHYSNEAHALTVYVSLLPPTWSYLYNNPDNLDDYANGIAVGPDNSPVVTGYSQRTVGGFDYYTVKLNRADKSVLWSDLYDDPDSEMDVAKCVAVDGNNNAIVSGYAQLYNPAALRNINSIYTLKYPSAGPPPVWGAQYNGPGAIDDRATAIAAIADAANNIVVIGYGKNAANNDDVYVVKYAADGSKTWSATPFDGAGGDDIPSAVVVAPDGSVYVTGVTEKGAGAAVYSFFTAKYNGSTGALVWVDPYSLTLSGDNQGNGIAADAAGNIYVTGYATNAAGNRDIHTIKYSGSSGTAQRLWERSIDGLAHGDDQGIGVRVDPIDGAIVVAGTTLSGNGNHDITLARYTASGDTVWQITLQRPDNDDHANALSIDSSGYIYVAGSTSAGAAADVLSLIYGSDGTRLGAMTYNGPAGDNDEASGIAVNYKGEAFISGYTVNASGNADYLVLKQVNPYMLAPAPFAAVGQADYGKITLTWGENTPGAGFLIERTLGPVTDGSVWTTIKTATAGTTSYQDTGLNGNTSYCYRIAAFTGTLFSRRIITCATTTLPPPPSNPLTIVSPTAIDISWANVAGNSGYKLERQASGGTWSQVVGYLAADVNLYHDTGLTAGIVYAYRVSALNSAGASLPGSVQVAPVLNPPGGITSAKIDLSWPAVSGATGYKVDRSPDNVTWTQIAAPLALAVGYSDTTIASGALYYYRLKAVTAAGDSVPSLSQSGIGKLKTPAITSATGISTSQITVAWSDPNGNESGYTLEYALCLSYSDPVNCGNAVTVDSAWGAWTALNQGANSTGATIGSLGAGRTYRFRATATLANADSNPSGLAAATTLLVAPTNLTATAATGSSVTLAWSDVFGETNYRVYRDGVLLTGTGLPLARNAVSYTVAGLTQNVQYCFMVQPYNALSSADSNSACVTLYGPPTLNSVTATGQTQVSLSWTDVPGATGFEVWQSAAAYQYSPPTSPSTGSWNAYVNLTTTPLPAGTTSYVKTGLTSGYTYKYKVRYKLSDGSYSPYSNELMTVTIPPTPASPYTTVLSTSQINLNWYDGYGESSYNVQVKPLAGAACSSEDWTGVASSPVAANTTYYYATGLTGGTVYCLRVNALNASGVSWATALTATTLLPAPTLNTLTGVTQSQISLSWDNVTGNTGYKVERSIDNSGWSQAALPAANVTTYTDSNLAPNQAYYYRVSTRNSAGAYSSPQSNVRSAVTLPLTTPVLNALTGVTTGQVVLSWNDVAGNAGYRIERSLDNASWTQIAAPAQGATGYTNIGLTAGTLYYYRVSTRSSLGYYSAPSNVQSAVTTPLAPSVSLSVASEARIDLSWQVVPGASNYKLLRSVGPDGPFTQVADPAIPYTTLYCGVSALPSIGCPTLVPAYASYADTGLTENVQYCYQLRAWNATGGDSSAGAAVCGKTPAVNSPNLTAATAVNSLKIRLDWSYNPAACVPTACAAPDGFEIWRQAWNGEWVSIDVVPNVATYLDTTSIEPQKSYLYKIRAYRGGDLSAFSNAWSVVTPAYAVGDTTCP